jgi:adenylate kinase family enzyme
LVGEEILVYARPQKDSKIVHKMKTVLDLVDDRHGTVVHFEDDLPVLLECSEALSGVRYIGLVVEDEKISRLSSKAEKVDALIIVGPPGSGKTEMCTRVEKEYPESIYISSDRITAKYLESNPGEKRALPDFIYKKLMGDISDALQQGKMLIVDMCNDSATILKKLTKNPKINPIVVSFMDLTEKTKGRKTSIVLSKEYNDTLLERVYGRIDGTLPPNESTLVGIEKEKAKKIFDRKVGGCIVQAINESRGVENMNTGPNPTIEEMYTALLAHIEKTKVASVGSKSTVNAYVGIPTPTVESETPDGFVDVSHPHITVVPPNNEIGEHLSILGEEIVYFASDPFKIKDTVVRHVVDYLGKDNRHITISVRDGHKPFEAEVELKSVLKHRSSFPTTPYTMHTGYKVIM